MGWLRVGVVASGYALLLFVFMGWWSTEPAGIRVHPDLLLPLVLGVALETPLPFALGCALVWGFVADTLTGCLWGLHLGSYLLVVLLVYVASDRIDLRNQLYKMACVGMGSLLQSLVLGLYLTTTLRLPPYRISLWLPLLAGTVLIMVLTPVVVLPFAKYMESRRSG